MAALFVASVLFIFYAYVGYPVLMGITARLACKPRPADGRPDLPIAVLIPAFNEERVIETKIRNVLASDYRGELRVVVVVDGSSDRTAACAEKVQDRRVKVIVQPVRAGKMAAINRGMETISEPVVILTDAQELFAADAIGRLVAHFSDSTVGVVSGAVQMIDPHSGFARDIGAYWSYERWLRLSESRCGSTMGASGAIYALRRNCFRPLPEDTILDDVAIPFEVLRQGYSVKYEPRAIAYEHTAEEPAQELNRKRRTLAGNYQLIARYRDLLWPPWSANAFRFWSHKVFRLAVPYALVGALIGAFGLPTPMKWWALSLHGVFYGLAALAFMYRGRVKLRVLSIPYTFCMLNWAVITGSYAYVSGRQRGLWEHSK